MADEAFALSPISARAAQPSEQDYDAIREAFMETSRGRWFLGEYAKRNRNADTRLVLDAVARIEETLAAQKKPEHDPVLDQALASLRAALGHARDSAKAALYDLALEENLAPVRKGARVIREIAWRLREIGADGRICDLIDSQIGAIEGATGKLALGDLTAALNRAFDRIEEKIAGFDAGDAATFSPPQERSDVTPATVAEPEVQIEPETEAMPTAGTAHQAESPAIDQEMMAEAVAASAAEAVSEPVDVFDANDEAMLEMVAMEMGAPDTDEAYDPTVAEIGPKDYEIDVTFGAAGATDKHAIAAAPSAATPVQPVPEPEPDPTPSLGSSLLANGIVSRMRVSRPDPLAAIRRMSQTEKIAFFS
jgi:hypothetical protein